MTTEYPVCNGIERPDRRNLLLGSGLALIAAGLPVHSLAQAQGFDTAPNADEQHNIDVVNAFCKAWETRNLDAVISHFIPDFVYRMSQDTPPITGGAALKEVMQPWVDSSDAITYEVLATFARGPLVINHRIDTYHSRTRPLTWEGMGVFLMQDGKIREWFDYTMRMERSAVTP
ncbi:MAG: nuclear transport factor 2 family protein [Gammaproteobacteria bacterium]|nr:nuclear transport factor 2 family protein [Gammaproteobacteria bacterium]